MNNADKVKKINSEDMPNGFENPEEELDEEEMVIADMSMVRKPNVFLPSRLRGEESLPGGAVSGMGFGGAPSNSDIVASELSPEETKWAILGSLKAAVLIGGAYIVGLGLVVLTMFLLFKYFA